MTIRGWKFEDILRISELEKECFPKEPWSYRYACGQLFGRKFYRDTVRRRRRGRGYGGVTVGYDTADIDNIAVAENYRGGGIGGAILEALVAAARERGACRVFLEVRVSNSVAMSMYLKHGFKGVYARARYYTDGEDCLVMARDI